MELDKRLFTGMSNMKYVQDLEHEDILEDTMDTARLLP